LAVDDTTRVVRQARAAREEPAHVRPKSGAREAGGVQSVARALTLLEIIADLGGEASLGDIAEKASLNVSTCHHLLSTLVSKGYAARGVNRRSYALGARILYLSNICLRQVDLPRRATPFVDRLNFSTGETVHLAVLQGNNVIKVLKREARYPIRVDSEALGRSDAAHATSTGKAILAWLSDDEVAQFVAERGMKRFTERTITDLRKLIEELAHVRRDGFALDREEFIPGVICFAVPIRDHAGAVLGAIGVSTLTMRATEQHLALIRNELMSAARALSAELGAPAA
jgi:IclR family acetate operon transcriptional repressor